MNNRTFSQTIQPNSIIYTNIIQHPHQQIPKKQMKFLKKMYKDF